jgi:hypothetical protein
MELTSSCTRCGRVLREPGIGPGHALRCAGCGLTRELHDEAFEDDGLHACPSCETRDLYIQKDFPHGLGLAILFVGFAISTVFWYYMMPVATFAVLLATVFLDWILYHRVPDVTICYRCLSQIRGPGSNPDSRYKPFDLAVGERYRQERIRLEQLRSGGST